MPIHDKTKNYLLAVNFDDLVKSQKYPLSLDGRGLALWSKFQYSTG